MDDSAKLGLKLSADWIEEYRRRLLPHYVEMARNDIVKKINGERSLSFFCAQWGACFPREENSGLLFVGRATNGWDSGGLNEVLDARVFNRPDQMEWIADCWKSRLSADGKRCWSGSRSAFWRVIRAVSEHYYVHEWNRHIAWSNLCKCSFVEKGNPTSRLRVATATQLREILKADIKMLSPKAIIMITGGWEEGILNEVTGNMPCETVNLDGAALKKCVVDGRIFIVSGRPEGRPERPIVDAVCAVIDSFGGDISCCTSIPGCVRGLCSDSAIEYPDSFCHWRH